MSPQRRRLAQRRRTVGLSQESLAGLLGVDRSTVMRWEYGKTLPQPCHRPGLADALGLTVDEVAALLSDEEHEHHRMVPGGHASAGSRRSQVPAAIVEVADALTGHPRRRDGPAPEKHVLAEIAVRAKRSYQAGPYRQALDQLPDALTALTAADPTAPSQVAAGLYQTTCSVLLKFGEPGLALVAADRSAAAAAATGDPATMGASARAVVHALATNGHGTRAVATALTAAQQLEHTAGLSDPAAVTVYGALMLRAALLAAGAGDRDTAHEALGQAQQHANRLPADGGASDVHHTYFCTPNVQLHRVGVAVRLGDAGQAVQHARHIDPTHIRLGERRACYLLDLTHAYTTRGKPREAYEALCHAEQAAAQEVALRSELITDLRRRCPPSLQHPLGWLADRIGAPA